jgi:hypothetical protein
MTLSPPKQTDPLAKFVRTGEGVLIFAFNLAMLIVPIVSNALTPDQAVRWAAILNGVVVIARTGLKIVAVVQRQTGIAPAPVGVPGPTTDPIPSPSPVTNGQAPPGAIVAPGASGMPAGGSLVSDSDEFGSAPSPVDIATSATQAPGTVGPPVTVNGAAMPADTAGMPGASAAPPVLAPVGGQPS